MSNALTLWRTWILEGRRGAPRFFPADPLAQRVVSSRDHVGANSVIAAALPDDQLGRRRPPS